ncbi:MAG: hypothetical protein KatS3mg050_0258 [Litorilinea sp.]|nr:MAG: hypothetical protein KatS3mg050_0258 [Litorilinea sp.]
MGMHFVTGRVMALYQENSLSMGKVWVDGAITRISLDLLPGVAVGDVVLIHAGVALSKVEPTAPSSTGQPANQTTSGR